MKKSPKANKPIDLSIIILNYNARDYLVNCIKSISLSKLEKYRIEVITIDNGSTDDSYDIAKKAFYKKNTPRIIYKFTKTNQNIGFSKGNNAALPYLDRTSPLVLFLNPDTTVEPNTLKKMIDFFCRRPNVDAATCYVTLALTGKLQPECHRGFPTPLNTFWHFFGFGLPKLFPKSKFFNGYFMGHLDYSKIQKIEACVGAFLMVRRKAGEAIGWWNEKYFMYGEDLDFCYKLHQQGYSLYFYPHAKINHYQGVSSGIKSVSQKITKASRETKIRSAKATTNAMRIFYKENLINNYPRFLQGVIWNGIKLLEYYRVFKAKYL